MKARIGDLVVGYSATGDGPAVVMVHGLAEDRKSWASVQRELQTYESFAYDVRGHGETKLGSADGTLEQLGQDLINFVESISGSAACIGYSLGGMIVLWAAGERPDHIRHAVVAGTSSVVGLAAIGFFEARVAAIKRDFGEFATDLRKDTAAQLCCARDELDAVVSRRLDAVGNGAGYVNAARAMLRVAEEPLTPRLKKVRCPVDVISGEHDVFCPRKAADILIGALPNAAFHEISGAGHLMSVDQPAAYANAIRAALDNRRTAQ